MMGIVRRLMYCRGWMVTPMSNPIIPIEAVFAFYALVYLHFHVLKPLGDRIESRIRGDSDG